MLAAHEDLESEAFFEPAGIHRAMVYTPQVAPLEAGADAGAELRNPCTSPREEVFASIRVAPPVDNYICREVEVDRRTLQRATVATPEGFLQQGVWLEAPTVARGRAAAPDPVVVSWLRRNRIAYLQPGTVDEALAPVRLDSPDDGAVVRRGTLVITGRADSKDLLGWSLTATRLGSVEEVILASGSSAVEGGVLGRWNSDEAPGGVYFLNLEVTDGYLGTIAHQIVVALPDDPSVAELEE